MKCFKLRSNRLEIRIVGKQRRAIWHDAFGQTLVGHVETELGFVGLVENDPEAGREFRV